MSTQRREKGSSIVRVLEILEAIATSEQPMSPTDLAFRLDIPKPTAHRLVNTLEAEGFIQANMRGNLIPGERFQRTALGALYASRDRAQRRAILQSLSRETGETCGIAIPDGTEMIYYDRVEANWPLRIHLPVGGRVPAWCTSGGKLYLSSLPDSRRSRLLNNLPLEQLARNTFITPESLEQELQRIDRHQYGEDNEEFIDGMVAIAVPIINDDGQLVASLFCHAPLVRKSLEQLRQYLPQMRYAATELSQLICERENNRIEK
ncbi:MAG: IclR family transcriptional regulator [Marinobacterium sp.]|nr:IclR family transcriptional regulator [Marinobacterium sp.]